jgi:hypothetical protein
MQRPSAAVTAARLPRESLRIGLRLGLELMTSLLGQRQRQRRRAEVAVWRDCASGWSATPLLGDLGGREVCRLQRLGELTVDAIGRDV